ncbi:MAG: sigma 54-interacting transcriptional regulator [Deltaproteobacteria bacterium]|nr:sigma 54-interacting transcriptional regulator [Deltaproteobacteria bacterium]
MPNYAPSVSPDKDIRDHLPAPLRRLAYENDVVRKFEQGDLILDKETSADHVVYVISGSAGLVLRNEENERMSVDSRGPGDIFGGIEFFTGVPWKSDTELVADEPVTALIIPSEEFEKLIRENPDFVVGLTKNLVRKIMSLDRLMLRSKLKRRTLHSLISQEYQIFPDYVIGEFVQNTLASKITELAESDGPALVIGESGVGKEVIAYQMYKMSRHGKEVFLVLDLHRASDKWVSSYMDSPVKEDEESLTEKQLRLLFGYEETGRDGLVKDTPGYFELSEGGTLLIRGIEKLTPVCQLKLMEAIVTDTFRRRGGLAQIQAKVRLIATTRLAPVSIKLENHPLVFGLLQRSITIPPLRERRREIPGLIRHYMKKYQDEFNRNLDDLSKETLDTLLNYSWPGNDLELANTLKRAILVCEAGVLRPQDIYFDLQRTQGKRKLNLFKFSFIKKAFLSPLYPASLQSAVTPFFFLILLFLFLGPSDPMNNPAALISWSLGWPILIVGSLFWARFWCSLCPIGVIANLAKKIVSFEKPFPTFLKRHSDFLIAGAVLFVIWFETATNIRSSPARLGFLLLAMLLSAILVSIVYERQSWCLYLCGLGGMVGVLSKTSFLELRANSNICIDQCSSNECFLGTSENVGCQFGHAGPRLRSNRVCRLCGQCVKNCPHSAITLNLRLPGEEIWQLSQRHAGTAFLVLGMIGGLFSEMVSKMPAYESLASNFPLSPVVFFTMVFLSIIIGLNLMTLVSAQISRQILGDSLRQNYARFGLALLPLTLTCFTAFHVYYLINLGVQIPILISRYFDIEILRSLIITVPPETTRFIQYFLILLGLIWTLVTDFNLGQWSEKPWSRKWIGLAPHAIVGLTISVLMVKAINAFFYNIS